MSASYFNHHMERTNGIVLPHTRGVEFGGGTLYIYVVSFPGVLKLVACPVDRCTERANKPGRLK